MIFRSNSEFFKTSAALFCLLFLEFPHVLVTHNRQFSDNTLMGNSQLSPFQYISFITLHKVFK